MIQNFNYIQSIIISLLIIIGLFNLSVNTRIFTKNLIQIKTDLFPVLINFFFYINFLSIITFNLFLYFEINKEIIKVISIVIILIGFIKPLSLLDFVKKIFFKKKSKTILIYLILLFYFLLSLLPISDPDTLDYHFTVPFYQLIFQNEVFPKYWLTSQLAGAGESFFLFGIVLGAIHLSQLLQFFSLFILIIFILNFSTDKYKFSEEKKFYVCLSILLVPALIFLITTSKPQIFPIVSNFFALILCLFYLPYLQNKNSKYLYCLILFLLISSIQFKFSFLLSATLISIFAFYEIIKKKEFFLLFLVPVILITLIIIPREFYEYSNLNSNFIYNFFNPVTDPYSSNEFNISLKHGTGNNRFLPFWMFIPYPNVSHLTYCLGLSVLYFISGFNLKIKLIKKTVFISFCFIILALIFAQPVGRFFFEPFIWLLFFSIFYFNKDKNILSNIIEKILLFVSIIFLIILAYHSLYFAKGLYKKNYFIDLMNNHTDGYLLYEWANKEIPDDSVILSTHRSLGLYKFKAISYEFRLFNTSKTNSGFNYYINHIINENPKYILYTSNELNKKTDILKNCRGKLFKFKKNVGYTAGRNPFYDKKYKIYYDGYIFHLDLNKLKKCKI